MNTVQKGILLILKSAITGEAYPLPEDFNLGDALPMIKKHHLDTLAYRGASNCGLNKKSPVMIELVGRYAAWMSRSEAQVAAINRLCAAFEENGIDYMPLKGTNMKPRYPKPELRIMGDADILVRAEQYDSICPVMENLGYTAVKESDHEYIWNSDGLRLELHRRLIPSYNLDYYAYYGDGWRLAKLRNGCRYAMTPEDEFIYLFTHFAKHYRDGGIGCRHVLDLWVYLRSFPNLDEAYIRTELRKLQLLEFHDNVRRLLNVWFEDGVGDDRTAMMTRFIFDSGSWGAAESHTLSQEVKRRRGITSFWDGKILSVWLLLFPTADDMTRRHPILEKAPWLLPVMWPVRWLDILLFKREKLGNEYREHLSANAKKVDAKQRAMNYVGLDFHFKEKTPQ